jgi:hypothetical protein
MNSTLPPEPAIKALARIVANPGAYGDLVEIVTLSNGGMTIVPLDDDMEPDEARRIVLDSDQSAELAARLHMDPVLASKIVAGGVLEYWRTRTNLTAPDNGWLHFVSGAIFGLCLALVFPLFL